MMSNDCFFLLLFVALFQMSSKNAKIAKIKTNICIYLWKMVHQIHYLLGAMQYIIYIFALLPVFFKFKYKLVVQYKG